MEEDQNLQGMPKVQEPEKAETQPSTGVMFSPIPVKSPKKKMTKTFLGIFILVIFVIGGFLIFKDNKPGSSEVTPTPLVRGVNDTETPTPTASPTPKAIERGKVSIEIENGTGIAGEAAYIRDILKGIGYADFKLGNTSSQDFVTTSVTFGKGVSQDVQDEITEKLKGVYKEVDAKTSSTSTVDVMVITGLRKGSTPKATATPTTSASPTSSPTASPSPTPTP